VSAAALTLVPQPEARRSLRALVETVDGLADAIETLDDGTLDDETRDALTAQLVATLAGTREKVDRTAGVLAMFEHLEAAAAAECQRLSKRVAFYCRQRERLETYVLAVLEASKLDRIDGETNSLQRRKNPAKVVIDDENAVPIDFLRFPPEQEPPPPVPDKALIAKALKANSQVPGCRLVQSMRLVRS
jgi:hypothetical protein